jgi:glycerol-1-phosphate dehydrogenase [NAD(P)+]
LKNNPSNNFSDQNSGHLMRLPRAVYIGYDSLDGLGRLMINENLQGPICVASGPNVRNLLGGRLADGLKSFQTLWVVIDSPTEVMARILEQKAKDKNAKTILAFGGGKTIDVAKVASVHLSLPMVSVPTSASHDGISSPFASLRDSGRPYSIVTVPPVMIVVDLNVILKAPPRLMKGGFGDMIAKLTAVKDWELGRDERGEYFGDYSANLARMSAQHVMDKAALISQTNPEGVRALVEALISSGVAAGIAGSSRPCSGAEHLISHALEIIAPGKGLHGEKTGLSTVITAKLHGLDWAAVRQSLIDAGCPVNFEQLGINKEQVVEAMMMAPKIRPDRYTILHKLKLSKPEIESLIFHTKVIDE